MVKISNNTYIRVKLIHYVFAATLLLSISGCGELVKDGENAGAIVLGDSSMIVTETDSQYLRDLVMDMEPLVETEAVQANEQVAQADGNPTSTVARDESKRVRGGFEINFGGFTATVTGVEGREFMQQNPKTQSGVSYAVASGELTEADLVISGLKNIKVRQRYQSILSLQSGNKNLLLQSMGKHTSDWKIISGTANGGNVIYSLKSLQHPDFKKISSNTLRRGVQQQAKSDRLSNASLNSWLKQARRVKSAGDPPSVVVLDNVQWQISGKDKAGKNVFKTLRFEP